MIIAISGPSGSGKSSIAKKLASENNMTYLCQDNFWFKNKKFLFQDNPYEQQRFYELAAEYNGAELARRVMLTAYPADQVGAKFDVVVEGFTVMAFPEIRKIVDHHFYIDVPWEECVRRRVSRDHEIDPRSTDAWIKLGKQFNELNVGFQRDLRNTTVINGLLLNEQAVDEISKKILALGLK